VKKIWWLIGIVFILVACSRTPQVTTQPTQETVFTDGDIDGATPSVATRVEEVTPQDLGELPNGNEIAALPNAEPATRELSTQAILPGANGFVYYIRYQAGITNPWSIQRANQASDVVTTIYSGQREIQSVGGSLDGNLVVLSMKQTTTASSDFEIYRLNVSTQSVQQLTNDTIDNTNVSSSANSLVTAWQQPVSGIAKIVLRTYASTTATTFTEKILSFTTAIRQSSLSSNGSYLVFVRDRADGFDQILRYEISSNTYLALLSGSTAATLLEHPSMSNDGNKVLWLQNVSGALTIRLRNVSANTSQPVVSSSSTLEHPSITADGNFATYGYSARVPASVITVYTINLTSGQKTVVRSMLSSPSVLQLGMVWQKPIILPQANEQKVSFTLSENALVSQTSISSNTAVVGGRGSVFIFERSSQGVWQKTKQITLPIDNPVNNPVPESSAVAISGDIVVVGSASITNSNIYFAGAIYIYERNRGGINNWGFVKGIKATTEENLGAALSLVGDTLTVGAPATRYDDNTPEAGAVYIFRRNQGGANNWGQVKKIFASNPTFLSHFGSTLAISGNTLVVGSLPRSDVQGFSGYFAYIFARDQGGTDNWGEVKRLSNNNLSKEFGYSVSISGNTAVVAANADYDADINGIVECSNTTQNECDLEAVYLYSQNQGGTNNWGLSKKLTPPNFTGSPNTDGPIAISGNRLIIGSQFDLSSLDPFPSNAQSTGGAAYVFERDKGGIGNWGETVKIAASDRNALDYFGTSVAIEGSTLSVGMPTQSGSDSVYFYTLE
jgi:FG-GAP repeat/WD40-like Beta Propeller Repeat